MSGRQPDEAAGEPISSAVEAVTFDDLLSRELTAPTVIDLEAPAIPAPTDQAPADPAPAMPEPVQPTPAPVVLAPEYPRRPAPIERPLAVNPYSLPDRPVRGFQQSGFWDRYDEATASAELFAVPAAAITVVVGSLDIAVPVAQQCLAGHWVSDCDVFVLTELDHLPAEPTWETLHRPSDVVAVLEDGRSDFPLLVLDIPRELPAWVRPLVARLRESGLGLVHYVLDDDPSDEDLATWHGELGRPAVLDLARPISPERVLELLDRGEPIASVAGMPITPELLLALRLADQRV